MKADFSHQRGTLLLWPTRRDVWRAGAKPIAKTVLQLALAIAEFEPVLLGYSPDVDPQATGLSALKHKNITVCPLPYDDIWARDTAPVPVCDRLVCFNFNAWGGDEGLYADWQNDLALPRAVGDRLKIPLDTSPLTLEGGALATDGKGTLIAVKRTICNDNRNKGLSQQEIEQELKRALALRQIIWLDEGLALDETGGHVDNLLAFADERRILLAFTEDKESPQYQTVRAAERTLMGATNAQGQPYEIIKVPLPRAFQRTAADCEGLEAVRGSRSRSEGELIQPSYINFVFANGAVILPTFGDPADGEVQRLFEKAFPDRKIVPLPAREIVLGGGGLHCITKNF